MSKKSRAAKARQRETDRQRQEKLSEEEQAELDRDRQRFGEVLFSATYEANERIIANASVLYLPQDRSHIAVGAAIAAIIGAAVCMIIGVAQTIVVLLICLAVAALGSYLASRWSDIQLWAIMRTDLVDPSGDLRRHVIVTPNSLIVEGPEGVSKTYALTDVRKVRRNDSGTIILLPKRHVAYIPLASLGEKQTGRLVDFLVEHKG